MECFSPQDVKALIEKVGIPIEDSEKAINALVSQLNSILERFRLGRRETRAEMMEKLRESERILKRTRKLIDPDRNPALVIAGYFYAKKHRKQHPGFPIQGIIEVDPETGKKTLQRGTLSRSLYRVEQLISHVTRFSTGLRILTPLKAVLDLPNCGSLGKNCLNCSNGYSIGHFQIPAPAPAQGL